MYRHKYYIFDSKNKGYVCVVKVSTSFWCFIIQFDVSLNKHSNFWRKKVLRHIRIIHTSLTNCVNKEVLLYYKNEEIECWYFASLFRYLYLFWISIILLICIPHNIFVLTTYLKRWLSQFQSHLVLRRLYSFTETKMKIFVHCKMQNCNRNRLLRWQFIKKISHNEQMCNWKCICVQDIS